MKIPTVMKQQDQTSQQTLCVKRKSLSTYLSYCFLLLCFSACKNTRVVVDPSIPKLPPHKEYESIVSNVARLQALLTGSFVQQVEQSIQGKRVYRTWKVNDEQDSIILYSIPVGEPNKIGYWIYHYQIMTSLPNEPVYEAFEHLEVIQRDSIKSVYYEAPESFNIPLATLLKQQRTSFEEIPFSKLVVEEDGGIYVREKILYFTNKTSIVANPQGADYKIDIYNIKPNSIDYKTLFYTDAEGANLIERVSSRFVKLENFK